MSRYIQLILQATTMFTKVFGTLYQKLIQDGRPGRGPQSISRITKRMKSDEALKILNIEPKNLNRSILEQQYKKYFESNAPGKGGSFYLQSKIYRAKEALERELTKNSRSSS